MFSRSEKILKYGLGAGSPKKDFRKKMLLRDNIDLEQWSSNLEHILYAVYNKHRYREGRNFFDDVTPRGKVTHLVDKIIENILPPGIYYPLSLDLDECAWYIAGYPDVIDYYYPTVDYAKIFDSGSLKDGSDRDNYIEKEKQRIDAQRSKVENDFNRAEVLHSRLYGNKEPRGTYLVLALHQDYLSNISNKFLLAKK